MGWAVVCQSDLALVFSTEIEAQIKSANQSDLVGLDVVGNSSAHCVQSDLVGLEIDGRKSVRLAL